MKFHSLQTIKNLLSGPCLRRFGRSSAPRWELAGALFCAALLTSLKAADLPDSDKSPAPTPSQTEMSDTATRLELAKVLTYGKRYAEAIEAYREVLAAEPDNIEAKIGLSEVLYWSGNTEAAAAILKGVPEDKLDEKRKLMLADLLIAKRDYEPALKILSAYLEHNQGDLAVRLKMADVQSWMKRYSEAIANYEVILKARPQDRQVRRKYGMVLSWAGQNEKAAEQLRKSLNE
jgi:thioredoxin-like negative regulator of GroEL